jgi:hypothetical protein
MGGNCDYTEKLAELNEGNDSSDLNPQCMTLVIVMPCSAVVHVNEHFFLRSSLLASKL